MKWLNDLFRKPCDCDACAERHRTPSASPNVSHGLHFWVGRDGNIHYRAKSSWRPDHD